MGAQEERVLQLLKLLGPKDVLGEANCKTSSAPCDSKNKKYRCLACNENYCSNCQGTNDHGDCLCLRCATWINTKFGWFKKVEKSNALIP